MMGRLAVVRLSVIACSVALAGCQGIQPFLPRDETPVLPPAFAVDVPRGASTQRLDEDGYPLIGAFPSTAAAQATPEAVAQTQARYADVGTRAAPNPAGYGRTVDELSAIAREQQRRATAR